MTKKGNLGNYAVCAAVTVLTACAANPVEDKTKESVQIATETVATKKPAVVSVAKAQKTSEVKKVQPVLSAKAAQEKKKQIIAMGKSKPVVVAKPKVVARVAPKNVKKPVVIAKVKPPVVKKTVVARPAPKASKKPVVVARAPIRKPVVAQPVRKRQTVQQRPNISTAQKPRLQYAVNKQQRPQYQRAVVRKPTTVRRLPRIDQEKAFGYALSNAAINRTKHRVRYDGSYVKIGYPWGDVPKSIGVCTDVVIRAYRKLGIDLQQEVHKDISNDFYAYPNLAKWGLTKPDPNIDHRRVYNLQAFFKRHKAELPRSRNPKDYKPGDLVTWMVGPAFPHIGVVVNVPSKADPNRLMISHNIGAGPKIEDILFRFPMTGHYRYTPKNRKVNPALHFAKTPAPPSVRKQTAMDYDALLKASRVLLGNDNKAKAKKDENLLQVKQTEPKRINLAQLDPAMLKALLKN